MTPEPITSDPLPEALRSVGADPQTETLRLTTLLTAIRPQWPGALILSVGLTPQGAALARAANIAGAACLSLDPSPELCRAALRTGAVDFVVNTLDEALRALKNEIRQEHPLSVALQADPSPVLAEILDRGLLPQLFTAFDTPGMPDDLPAIQRAAEALGRFGTPIVDLDSTLASSPLARNAAQLLTAYTDSHGLTLETLSFSSSVDLRACDALLSNIVPANSSVRRWILAAPRHFSRASPPGTYRRAVLLTADEREQLRHRLAGAKAVNP